MMPGDDHDIVDMATFGLIFRFGLHTKLSTGALQAYEYLNKARAEDMKKLLAKLGTDVRFYDPVVDEDICKNDNIFSDYVIRQGFYKTTDNKAEALNNEMLAPEFDALEGLMPYLVLTMAGNLHLEPDFNMFYNQIAFFKIHGGGARLDKISSSTPMLAGLLLTDTAIAKSLKLKGTKGSDSGGGGGGNSSIGKLDKLVTGSTVNQQTVLNRVMAADISSKDQTKSIDELARCHDDIPYLRSLYTMDGSAYVDWLLWSGQRKDLNKKAIDDYFKRSTDMPIEVYMRDNGLVGDTSKHLAQYHAALWKAVFGEPVFAAELLSIVEAPMFEGLIVPDVAVFNQLQAMAVGYIKHYVMDYNMTTNEPLPPKSKLQLDAAWEDMTHRPNGHRSGVWYYTEIIKRERSETKSLAVDHYEKQFIIYQSPVGIVINVGEVSINAYLERLSRIAAHIAYHDKTKMKSDKEVMVAMMRFLSRVSFDFDKVPMQLMLKSEYFTSLSELSDRLSKLDALGKETLDAKAVDELKRGIVLFDFASLDKIKDKAVELLDDIKRSIGYDVVTRDIDDKSYPFYDDDLPHETQQSLAVFSNDDVLDHILYLDEIGKLSDSGIHDLDVLMTAADDGDDRAMVEVLDNFRGEEAFMTDLSRRKGAAPSSSRTSTTSRSSASTDVFTSRKAGACRTPG